MMIRALTALALIATSSAALAQETEAQTPPVSFFTGDYFLQVFGSMALVIGLMVAVLWFLRRFNGVGRGAGIGSPLSVVASVGLGQRERAVLVEAGDKQILVGVAQGHITTLHVFDEPVVVAKAAQPQSGMAFADALRQVARGGSAS
jgi:flagellar protein FliO/FliZ